MVKGVEHLRQTVMRLEGGTFDKPPWGDGSDLEAMDDGIVDRRGRKKAGICG